MATYAIESVVQAASADPERAHKARETMDAIFRRSATDRPFRQKLVTDPKAALTEYAGHPMPDNFNVKFVEKQGDVTIVLPAPAAAAVELNDAELEMVAGGVTPILVASSLECVASALWVAAAVASWFD
jgi:hypothetical protein